ncbi:hypothetical protein [Edaphovirga cremea]|uniref:hypothetical protein n=1 Tax=Edaphovirga cremea TaxID=2267246 RepID=UPI00398A0067
MFGIFPKDAPITIENELVLPAEIVIDDFQEKINLPLSYWSLSDYKKSWLKSLESGLTNKDHAVLAVSMYEPEQSNFIFVWVVYFEGNNTYLQNSVIFLDECKGFTPDKINEFIEYRTTHDEDGVKISEWSTDLQSVLSFYNSLKNDRIPCTPT